MDSSGNSTGISGFFLFYGVFTGTACFKFKPVRHPPSLSFLVVKQIKPYFLNVSCLMD